MPRSARLALRACLLVAATVAATATSASAQPTAPGHRVKSLDITILSTMLADEGFGEWGFAALVEVDGRRILFDTGAHEDTVQRNLRELKLDLSDVELVILSHNHDDHTTGLMTLRRQFAAANPKALSTAYAGTGLFYPRLGANGQVNDRMSDDPAAVRGHRRQGDRRGRADGDRARRVADRAGAARPPRTQLERHRHRCARRPATSRTPCPRT